MKNLYRLFLAIGLIVASSCNDDILDVSDPNNLVTSSVFGNYQTAVQAVNGAYTPLKEVNLWGDQIHFLLHQITNEYNLIWQGDAGWNQIKDFSITPGNTTINAAWEGLSKLILRSNAVLEGVSVVVVSGDFTQTQKDELIGQAYFLRGYAFLLGVSIFGEKPVSVDGTVPGFPLILSVPGTRAETLVDRATVDAVYEQIRLDFEMAESLLPTAWSSADLGRVTSGAASAYLGKAYLYQENWPKAIENFEKVINSGSYSLLENYADNFNGNAENGSESIFEVQFSRASPVVGFDGGPGHIYSTRHAPSELNAFGNVFIAESVYNTIQSDPRSDAIVIRPGDYLPFIDTVYVGTGPTDYRPRKFIDVTTSQINNPLGGVFNGHINMPMMRLADVYLMYAEALNEDGNASMALEYVNKVRRRAYSEPIDSPSVSADINVAGGAPLRTAIQEERYVELFGEGHRWFDLLRWGLADEVLGSRGFNANIHQAMPIPIDEIQLNTVISQNNGY